ncbi:uncharacterized protein LOC119090050 [Pollicipes pollicipes]|uniref:uncharacterized protein LOC119090050 n=1 Tax=Pollicipes pollicipes TaxID=41117 RepID=UPI001884CBB2|nr:uncharacterized protein LOC119090050 [Pollicipes pollicipes]
MDDEEDSIFVKTLRRYEELKQEATERLAELDPSPEELSPKPDRWVDDLLSQLSQEDVAEARPEPAPAAVEPEFTARVQAGPLLIRLRMRRSEELRRLFEAVAEQLSLPVGRVYLGQRDVVYRPHQTPDDVRLGAFDVIDFWEGSGAAPDAAADGPPGPNSVELKLQSADRRSTLLLRLARTETMASLMARYAAQRGRPLDRLRFRFDGETLNPADTADSLELEGGECVDVHEC